ncbi:MAG: pyrroline-5-carboxylate reductase dimerization domain-containing protein, partial [Candidatus Bathyarchaeia archaeon]
MVRESFTAYSVDPEVNQEELEAAIKLLSVFGKVHRVEEKYMDAITALSGSAPAYMAIVADAMTYAGLEIGLDRDLALMIAAHAMISTGKLIIDGGKTPSQICAMVTTPGGVTIEGLFELERFPVRHAFMRAVKAATDKARRLALAFK